MSTLLEIDGCSVSQFMAGASDIPLNDGPLALVKSANGDLALVCGSSAFALKPTTHFFTHADSPRLYFFTPELGDVVGSGSYIKVLLPEGIIERDSDLEKQRDQLESILVDNGFLKDAPVSTEMIGRGITDQASAIAASIHSTTQNYTANHQGSTANVDPSTGSTLKDYSNTAVDYTRSAVNTVNTLVAGAGQKVGQALGFEEFANRPEDEKTETRVNIESGLISAKEGIEDLTAGASEGASKVYSAATVNADKAIRHDYGDDAAQASQNVGESVKNVGEIAADGAMAANATVHGVNAGLGALKPLEGALEKQ